MAKKLLTSPRGVAVYPYLNNPDFGNDTFKNPQGVYRVKLRISAEEAASIIETIDQAAEENYKKVKSETETASKRKKLKQADPSYEELDDGSYEIQFKNNASGVRDDKTTWTWHPQFFDVKGKPIPFDEVPQIGGGSIIKVSYFLKPYDMKNDVGVAIKLKAIQLIKLVAFGEVTAEDCGFEEEDDEDGFDLSDHETSEKKKKKKTSEFDDESDESDEDDNDDDEDSDDDGGGGDESLEDF